MVSGSFQNRGTDQAGVCSSDANYLIEDCLLPDMLLLEQHQLMAKARVVSAVQQKLRTVDFHMMNWSPIVPQQPMIPTALSSLRWQVTPKCRQT